MARRRSRSNRGGDGKQTTNFADRIAAATRREATSEDPGEVPRVISQGLTRYQRRTANLPSGATPLTVEERTNIVIDLRDAEEPPAQ